MVLEFRKYRKKLKNKKELELDFKVEDGTTLLIVGNEREEIDFIKDSFREKTKFKGKILFDDENISKQELLFANDFGLYPHLSTQKNLQKMLKLFDVKISNEEIADRISHLNIDPSVQYKKLLTQDRIKLHTLFSILIEQDIFVIDNNEKALTKTDKHLIKELILEKSNDVTVVIFDTSLNKFNDICEDVVVISDAEQSYFGKLADLLVIKQLVALHVSHKDSLDIILQNYEYINYNEEEIVVREEVLENVVYELLKNGIEVHQMRNLGEKIKLYTKEEE